MIRRIAVLAALVPAIALAQQAVKIEGTAKVRVDPAYLSTVAALQGGTWTVQPGNAANSTAWVVRIVDSAGSDLDVFKPNDLYTAAADHGLLVLGEDGGTPARYRALKMDSTGAVRVDPTGTTSQPVAGAATPSDAFTNPTTAVTGWALVGGWDDATSKWVRVSTDRTDGDDVAVHTTASALDTDAHLRMFDGTNWDRVRGTTGFGLYSDLRGINGATPLTGNGTTGTGSLRVTMASDTTPYAVKIDQTTPGTTDKVTANISQIGGNTILTGNGTTGTGSQRVTVASDNTPFAVKTDQTTHGTTDKVAADAYVQGAAVITGNLTGTIAVGGGVADDSSTTTVYPVKVAGVAVADGAVTAVTAGRPYNLPIDTQRRVLVRIAHPNTWSCLQSGATATIECKALTASTKHYLTSVVLSNGPTAQTLQIVTGTGTNCATNQANLTSTIYLPINGGAVLNFEGSPLAPTVGHAICCKPSGSTAFSCTLAGFSAP